jgi:hypothetical protein
MQHAAAAASLRHQASGQSMGITNAEVKRIVRAIQTLGARGAPFQFQALREKVGIEANETVRSAYTHNLLKELLSRGVLEVVSGDRQRHRYYRVKSEWKLEALAQPTSPFFYDVESKSKGRASKVVKASRVKAGEPATEGIDRESINRIGDSIQKIYLRLENIETALAEIRMLWK